MDAAEPRTPRMLRIPKSKSRRKRDFSKEMKPRLLEKSFSAAAGKVTKWQDQQNFLYFCRQSMREITLVNAWLN
jgi:hypothetical protein